MANINDIKTLLKSDLAKGVAIGAGVAGVAAIAAPFLAHKARPLLRAAIKSGILFAEISREAFSEVSESLDDIVAEVRSELAVRHAEEVAEATVGVAGESGEP